MKNIFITILILSSVISAHAAVLTPDEALARALRSDGPARVAAEAAEGTRLIFTGDAPDGEPAYYIFTGKRGTLFLGGDDMAEALLGYSDIADATTADMPPQLTWWLGEYAREIEWARERESHSNIRLVNASSTDPAGSAQTETAATKRDASYRPAIGPLLTTTWDQGAPYNNLCPLIDGQRSVAGCVATAMAQVMKYYEWPQASTPTISYELNGTTLTAPARKFNWDNMLDSYAGSYTWAQGNAVAQLIQSAGYAVQMDYSPVASGASSSNVRRAMVDKFGYDKGAELLYRPVFTVDEWTRMIYENLRDFGPIYYSGNGTVGAHAFVCDGYDGTGRFHFNWGWSGMSDGYFLLSALNPEVLGIGGGAGGFNFQQQALLYLRRPVEGSMAPEPYLGCTSSLVVKISAYGLNFACSNNGVFGNLADEGANFTLGAKFVNVSTGSVTYSIGAQCYLESWYGTYSYDTPIPYGLTSGLYKVYPAYYVTDGNWHDIRFNAGYPDFTYLEVNGSSISIPADEGAITVAEPYITMDLASGEHFDFIVAVGNSYPESRTCTIDAYLCTRGQEDDTLLFYVQTALGSETATIPAHSAAEMNYSGNLPTLAPDEYYIVLMQGQDVYGYYPVNVTNASGISIVDAAVPVAPRYYNLQGIEVPADRLTPGLYLLPGTSRKVIIK
ncbi:MAG: C10 family peptidase [Muribaculaceae bacterium]|nr:C10 family peptidase [Muribaculaceae bacterium]